MRLLLIIAFSLLSLTSWAEQKQVFGDYEVHYMGLTSSELDPNVTRIYDIPRSRNVGFLNLSVLKKGQSDLPVAWNATIEGEMSNLIGQTRTLEFRRIQETSALYFISTFDFYDQNTYRFHLKVTPEGSDRTYDVKFSQKFYRGE